MKKFLKMAAALLCSAVLAAAGCSASPQSSESPAAASESTQATQAAAEQTAASGGNLDPDNPVTITLWHYYTGENQQELDSAVSEFNETVGREQGVVVEAVPMGNLSELEEAVTNSAKGVIHSEEMPNIFSCYADKALELDELDALCDLSAYFTKEEQDQYVSGFIEDGIFDSRLLVLPIVKSTELLYVNKTALDEFSAANTEANAESSLGTWQSLYNLSKAYYEWQDAMTPDTPWDGKGFMGIDELANFIIISNKQLGVDIMDGSTATVNLDRETMKTIFDVYYPAMCLGYFDQVGRFCSDDVKTGDLAAYVGSSSSASYFPTFTEINNEQVDIDLLAASYPVFEGGEPYTVQQGAGMAVSKSDPAKEEGSCLFLKWFTDVPQNVPFAMKTGYLPVKTAAYDSSEFEDAMGSLQQSSTRGDKNVEQVYSIALEVIEDGYPYAAKPFLDSYEVRSVLKDSLTTIVTAGRETAEPLKAAGDTADEILAQLDVDAQFDEWMTTIRSELDTIGVTYTDTGAE